jgi:hypothetical protein
MPATTEFLGVHRELGKIELNSGSLGKSLHGPTQGNYEPQE